MLFYYDQQLKQKIKAIVHLTDRRGRVKRKIERATNMKRGKQPSQLNCIIIVLICDPSLSDQ